MLRTFVSALLFLSLFANTACLAQQVDTSPAAIPDVDEIYDQGVKEARANLTEKLVKLPPDSPEQAKLLLRLSALEYADDDYLPALKHLEAVQSIPNLSTEDKIAAERFIGLTDLALGKPKEAISHYEEAMHLLDSQTSNSATALQRFRIVRGLNEATESSGALDKLVEGLKNEAQIAKDLNLHCEAGWAFLNLSDAQKKSGLKEDAARSYDRAIVEFTRFFDQPRSEGEAVPADLWEALDAGPQRPPGAYWKSNVMPPKAVLICIHGLGLHSGYYEALGKALSQRGVSVVAMDVRGFGEWASTRDKQSMQIDDAVDDAVDLTHALKQLNPNVPIFLLGESMGGAIALRAAKTADVVGVISSVPAADRYNAFKTKMRVAWHVIKAGNSLYDVRRDVVDRVSHDEALRESWECDRLAKLQYAPTQLIGFNRFMKQNLREASAISRPVLITQGDRDELVKADSTIKLFRAIGSNQKDLLLIGTAEHLIFEAGQFSPLLVDSIVGWMDAVSGGRAGYRQPEAPAGPSASR